MREHGTHLYFLLRRGWLYAQGLFQFGPRRTRRWGKAVHIAFDAFEDYYERLPESDEQSRLVQKLLWFDQQYQRGPTKEEVVQIVQQLEIC